MAEWIAYVDESGSKTGARGKPGRFVLACVAGSPSAIAELTRKIRNLKLKLVPRKDPANWELHASDMFHGRSVSPLGSIGKAGQIDVMQKIVDIVCDSDVVLFKVVVTITCGRRKHVTEAKTVERAMEALVDQMEQFAERKDDVTFRIISDYVHEKHRLAMKRALERRARQRSMQSRTRKRRVMGIRFVDSRSREAVQAVDGVAHIINRHVGGDILFGGMFRNLGGKTGSYERPHVI